ncbi:MAG: MFS transporter [Actinobacteria bacterium]|nr:MFS transporter [Actinomycetota bacterium]
MLTPYVDVLRRPGALAFSAVGLLGRLPMSMEGLGVILLVSITQGAYALAGVLSSILALSAAFISPLTSRWSDRFGQAVILRVIAPAQAVALTLIVVAVRADAPTAVLVLLAILGGAFQPNVGSMVRARWAAMLSGTPQLGIAFALESVLDEVIFILGPVLATGLAIGVSPGAGLIAAAVLVIIGGLSLAAQHRTQPEPVSAAQAHLNRDRMGTAVPIVGLIFLCLGICFGGLEVGVVAFSTEAGIPWASGVLLALFSVGSAFGGIVFGPRVAGRDLPRQLLFVLAISIFAVIPITLVRTPAQLAVVALLSGVIIAPSLICGFTIVENLVPSSRLTESITWVSAGIGVGFAVAAGVCGVLIDAHGATAGLAVSVVGVALAALASLSTFPALERLWRARPAALDPAAHDFIE